MFKNPVFEHTFGSEKIKKLFLAVFIAAFGWGLQKN
jgi:hypothetical protein